MSKTNKALAVWLISAVLCYFWTRSCQTESFHHWTHQDRMATLIISVVLTPIGLLACLVHTFGAGECSSEVKGCTGGWKADAYW